MKLLLLAALLALFAIVRVHPSSLKWDKNDPQNQNVRAYGPVCPKNCTAWCTEKYNKSYGICNRSAGMCSCALP